VTFGYGAKFPAKFQESLFILDWSWGKIYAIDLKAKGASYAGTKTDFISGGPLPVTDAIIHPKDGAMYFAIGGRKVQSGLYRVTYVGKESTAPISTAAKPSAERDLRHQLEAFHGRKDPKAVAFAWPHLRSPDRFIRWAARVAITHQPLSEWKDKALAETDPFARNEALLALAQVGGVCPFHRAGEIVVDAKLGSELLDGILKADWNSLNNDQRLALVRVTGIVLNRYGKPADATVQALIAKFDPAFPADSFELNWELCETLVALQAPSAAAKGIALINNAESQEPQMEYARSLRVLKSGWTPETRTAYLEWLFKAANYKGGASFEKFILDCDLIQMVSEFMQPLETTEDALGVEAIREVGPGGHFFGAQHTLARYTNAFYSPIVSDWRNNQQWLAAGKPEAWQKANAVWKQALADYQEPAIDDAIRDELNAFVDRRKAEGGAPTDF
jgi:hypothetical protein